MQDVSPLPENFTIKAALGIFKMKSIDSGIYEGEANGFVCNIAVSSKKVGNHYHAYLFCDSDRSDISSEVYGDFHYFDDMVLFISSWMDNTCADLIEDYAGDVKYLDTPYGKLAYWAYNTHLDSTPIVFVHGGPGGDSNPVKSRRWCFENPIYMFDQMGCGLSDPIKDLPNFKIDEYFDEMSAFIDMIPSDKVILLGASWGSGLSLYYAGRSKFSKVAALILPSPFISTSKWNEDTIENFRSMGQEYLDKFNQLVEKQDFGEEFRNLSAEFNARYLFNRGDFREIAVAAAMEEPNEVFKVLCGPNDMVTNGLLKDFDVTHYLDDIRVPTLFMCGDSDEVTVPRIVEYHQRVKGSRLSIIPHAGHATTSEQFSAVREAFAAFLKENGF